MWFFVSATIISIIIKTYIAHQLWQTRGSQATIVALSVFLVILLSYIQSFIETYGYIHALFPGDSVTVLLRIYHANVTMYLLLLVVLSYAIITDKVNRTVIWSAASTGLLISIWFIGTDSLVVGAKPLGYTYTRIPGEFYWFFQFSVITTLLAGLTLLIFIYRTTQSEIQRVKAANTITGFVLLLLFFLSILIAMHSGLPINAAGILPLMLSLFLYLMVGSMRSAMIRDWRTSLWWWSRDYKEARHLTRHLYYKQIGSMNAKRLANEYMQSLVSSVTRLYPRQIDAAEVLNISPSSVSRLQSDIKSKKEMDQS